MYALIPVNARMLGGVEVLMVDGRDIHAFLNLGKKFNAWMKVQIKRLRLVRDRDYVVWTLKGPSKYAEVERIDYFFTLNAAEHICMISDTEKGHEVREYFIALEREFLDTKTHWTPASAILEIGKVLVDMEKRLTGHDADIRALRSALVSPGGQMSVQAYANFKSYTITKGDASFLGQRCVVRSRQLARDTCKLPYGNVNTYDLDVLGYVFRRYFGAVRLIGG